MNTALFNPNNNQLVVQFTEALNESVILCDYVPSDVSLSLNIRNVEMVPSSTFFFKIILNGQYSREFISSILVNDDNSVLIKKNNLDNIGDENKSQYIIQKIIVENSSENVKSILTKIERYKTTNHPIDEDNSNLSLLTLQSISNDTKVAFKIINDIYYDITSSINLKEGLSDRKQFTISNVEELSKLDEFDEFIVNLYKDEELIEDTSGNENDTEEDNKIEIINNENQIVFENLDSNENISYRIEVMPVLNKQNDNSYYFNLKHFFTLKKIKIRTNGSLKTSAYIKEQILQIGYKYLDMKENYTFVDLENGIQILDANSDEQEHILQINTPGSFSSFKIQLSSSFNANEFSNITLIGDVDRNIE